MLQLSDPWVCSPLCTELRIFISLGRVGCTLSFENEIFPVAAGKWWVECNGLLLLKCYWIAAIFIFSSARSQLYQTLTCQTSRKLKQQSDNQNGCSKAHHLDRYLNVVDFTIFKEQLQRKKPSLGRDFTTMHHRSIPARGSIHFICNKRPYPPNIFFCSAQLCISADWWPYHVPLIKSLLLWWSQPFTSKGRQCCFEWPVVEWKQYQQVTNRWPPYLMRTVQGRNLWLTTKNFQKKKIEIPLWMFRLKCFMLNRHNIVLSKTNMGFFVRVYPK